MGLEEKRLWAKLWRTDTERRKAERELRQVKGQVKCYKRKPDRRTRRCGMVFVVDRMPLGWVRPTVGRYDGQSPGSQMGSWQESTLCPLPRWSLERECQDPGLPALFFLTVPQIFSPLTLLVQSPAKLALTGIPPHNRRT